MNFVFRLLSLFSLFILISCTNNESAGNTTEIENAIAIRIYSDGVPAARTSYKVLPSWYVADTTGETDESIYTYMGEADNDGWVRINSHLDGDYTIQLEKGKSAIILQYSLNSLTPEFIVDSTALQATGDITGWVSLPDSAEYAWVLVPGTDRVEKTDSAGNFTIKKLPAGCMGVRAWEPVSQTNIGQTQITVESGKTVDIGHVDIPGETIVKHSMKIAPRTLISDWMRPLADTTVLILRLDSTTFNFDEATENGSDVHLYNADGDELPMQIDEWDPKIKAAIINVRINDLADTSKPWTLEWGDIYEPVQKQVDVWKGLSDSLTYELNTLEIYNFEAGLLKNDLPESLRSGWYLVANTDSSAKEEAVITDTLFAKDMHSVLQKDTQGRKGTVFHATYSANSPNYVVFGTRLTAAQHDFSRLDSVVVWLRGDGDYEIVLETYSNNPKVKNYKASYKAKAKEKWERIVVRPEDFTHITRDYHGWEVTRNHVTHFTILAYNGHEIWIDNVRLYGINQDDLR